MFERLGTEPVSRQVATSWARQIRDASSALDAFIVAMIWGYGPVGYGPYRTARVIAATPHFPDVVYDIAEVARTQGGVAAYRYVSQRRSSDPGFLKHLGPAFGTKYIYFATKAVSDRPTPVMDAIVQRWFRTNMPSVPLTLDWSRPSSYEALVAHLDLWAAELSTAEAPVRVDDVEYLIFADQATSEGSGEWSETWAGTVAEWSGVRPKPERTESAIDLLTRLEDTLARRGKAAEAATHLMALYALVADSSGERRG
ncbi:hypothetical protein GCM10022204_36090 [Microlunatus aurantiacus]|uniref:Uncharacterized protein n=1 Tax=Microlunatus aurantiacus TaxID=446786 RepID=A0ABP7E3G1_9ACTN